MLFSLTAFLFQAEYTTHSMQAICINPKMDMRGPRGPRTTSNVCSTLTASPIIGFYLKLRFLQNVLWGPLRPQNHLV